MRVEPFWKFASSKGIKRHIILNVRKLNFEDNPRTDSSLSVLGSLTVRCQTRIYTHMILKVHNGVGGEGRGGVG